MRYYFASPYNRMHMFRRQKAKNFLYTFAGWAKYPYDEIEETDNVIIDSGAFSAWSAGVVIDIDEYIEFCKALPDDDRYWFVNLDVIPQTGSTIQQKAECAEEGYRNFLYLKKHLNRVLPVHHYGEDFDILERYQKHTDYVGLSPANDTPEKVKRQYLNSIFRHWNKKTKYHAFGYSSSEGLTIYPFYSADSTSWMAPGRFGHNVSIKDGMYDIGQNVTDKSELDSHNYMHVIDSHHAIRIEKAIAATLHFEKYLTRLWLKRGVDWNDTQNEN